MYNENDPRQKDALEQEGKVVRFLQKKGIKAELTPDRQFEGVDIEATGLFSTNPDKVVTLDVKSVFKHSATSFCLPYRSEEGNIRGIFRALSEADYAFIVLRNEEGEVQRRFAIKAKILREALNKATTICRDQGLRSGEANKKYNLGTTFYTDIGTGVGWARFYYDKFNRHIKEVE